MKLITIVTALCALIQTTAHARPMPRSAYEIQWLDYVAGRLAEEPYDSKTTEPEFDFSGQVRLSGCSGSLINFGQSANEPALVLTNGHCVGMMDLDPNVILSHQPVTASGVAYIDKDHSVPVTITEILYGMMQPHDLAIYQLKQTYRELLAQGVKSRRIASKSAKAGDTIIMASSYFRTVESCQIVSLIYEIHEDKYINQNSYKYRDCHGRHGTSGSPLILAATGEVIGINYTGNDSGERCTMDNPCEVDAQGNVTVEQGATYGDQVYKLMTCLDSKHLLDLNVPGCLLRK